jgi:hypothetical protein
MNTIYVKEKVVKYKTEIVELPHDLVIILYRQNSKVMSCSIVERSTLKINKKKNTFDVKSRFEYGDNWVYYRPEIFEKIKTKHFTHIAHHKFALDAYKEFKKHGKLDKKRLLHFDNSSHLIYRLGQDAPVSGIFLSSYIGGVNNENFHINKAFEHLKKRKSVLSVKVEEIPYYNRTQICTQGLDMSILLPQATINRMWEVCKKDKYPSCRLKDMLIPQTWRKNKIDPLGLKKCLRSEKDLERLKATERLCDDDLY